MEPECEEREKEKEGEKRERKLAEGKNWREAKKDAGGWNKKIIKVNGECFSSQDTFDFWGNNKNREDKKAKPLHKFL